MRPVGVDDSDLGKVYDRRLMARLVRYMRSYLGWLTLAGLLLLGLSGLELAGPLLVKLAIDRYISVGDLQGLNWIALLYLLVLAGIFGLRYGQTSALNLPGQRALHDLRIDLFQRLQRQSLAFFD